MASPWRYANSLDQGRIKELALPIRPYWMVNVVLVVTLSQW